jgi:hypothetical protein
MDWSRIEHLGNLKIEPRPALRALLFLSIERDSSPPRREIARRVEGLARHAARVRKRNVQNGTAVPK